mgnify:CR=1 FL=1
MCFQSFGSDWRLVRSNITGYTRDNHPPEVYDLPTQTIVNSDVKSAISNQFSFLSSQKKPVAASRTRSVSSSTKTNDRVVEVGPVIEVGLKPDDPHFLYNKPWSPEVDEQNMQDRVRLSLSLSLSLSLFLCLRVVPFGLIPAWILSSTDERSFGRIQLLRPRLSMGARN